MANKTRIPLHHINSHIKLQQSMMTKRKPQSYDYFLVLDFEATCCEEGKMRPQEVIEFPVLKVNAKTYEIDSSFHQFVKPKHHPILSRFCMDLTSITQEEVDGGKPFPEVFKDFDKWIKEDVGINNKFLFVTCGDWDLKTMLPSQCASENLQVPAYCKKWLNIKKSYAIVKGEYIKGMMPMIKGLGLTHTGRLHRGFDDCKNIANILKALADHGCTFLPTMTIE
ncbi:ERI1 exoribonuclease 3-like isoform X2 [Homarus americanus]|uniref:ERI1 exoribonuclease 3-like n=1 Tax=Homarus americanus TaxID=6706 RepID=A0A8J5JQ10_HOMAM|nr:ERI1 exoribonuclease 3-like isoform X2 [Homarus americanus]XP_042237604.1 ERI1 exoribonuclease 3-like isoform X2 [Homarus americanus]XP_042237605.1 ERI1 exoribonuclease 3-like isoform X2 [Homarus americanus]XP_042237606.1 ERI1 exoribonuclease 3-like isoform X2 [Homarus americanus]XP_042237607.1 ERI1 exoribonuclease 3-like isoform X2 [Homarus americanus]KAG7160218.1 ERI1 exoribonuclease 3-like [Homarus americanus]